MSIGQVYELRSGSTRFRTNAHASTASCNIMLSDPIFGEQEAQSEEEVELVVEEEEEPIALTLVPVAPFGPHLEGTNEEQVATNSEAPTLVEKPINHPSTFGNDISVRVLEEVIEGFILKRNQEAPRIPLCRLMENEAIRAVGPGTEGLVKRFEASGYSVFGAPFIVSFKKPGHDQQYVTENDKLEWDPIWRELSDEFDASLPPEWADLKEKKFLVWDGNHRLKTWMAMIKSRKHLSHFCVFECSA